VPRKLSVEYPGAIYHPPTFHFGAASPPLLGSGATSVMSRGSGRQAIFRGIADRQDFVKSLAGARDKTGFEIHAYGLMDNHFQGTE